MTKRIKRFFHAIAMDLLRLAVFAVICLAIALVLCFVFALPEIIGMLIFG